MSSHYSRQQKPRKSGGVPTQHIKTGFTAFQKSIALIGSILSIIVATITITRALQPASDTKTDNTSKESSNTIVKIIEKDSSQGNQSHKDSSENSDETKTILPPSSTTPSHNDTASTTTAVPDTPSTTEGTQLPNAAGTEDANTGLPTNP
ncbi:DUF6556 family protein [Streptococcus dysgalactiae]|uniref:DUF6556 family protein n=1 Tax=Streptococcus dysgalactiae TaxID=1334 RepID=UPI0001F861FD|nr:DUF6556 family protein [Streptococcus dysgalactiae]EFY02436.1 hypothetical protein SDD27957_03880 [Streptococcus dysgalactiae subsp. dysgalactiae ATCC 27957]MCB2829080.1 hypothetical protein [Streptococcus dysgalactiae subsp. dysgalactiae]MCB2831445.1 hypothetical protein [Streptococcus dysgalactiae subsp. dysgalactiae]MCB2835078.1 hypothetical protein [Streptococcus dysgalactiae subsp. dysgalactiae]MCB2837165.1 hypothetical protein [Streptococcus dysgalactiae subsp. dysgalactiae]